MIQFLYNIDLKLFIYINQKFTHPILDFFFIAITGKIFWVLLLVFFMMMNFQKKKIEKNCDYFNSLFYWFD